MHYNKFILTDESNNIIIKTYHSSLEPQIRDYRAHHHTECELSIFLKGSGIYVVGDRKYTFQEGDIFLFGSNEEHCITEVHEDMDILNIHFESKLLWENVDSVELLNIFAARNKNFSNKFLDKDLLLKNQFLMLERELSEKNFCHSLCAKSILFSILVYLIRNYDCIDPEKVINSPSSITRSLKRTIHYINENLGNKLTLKEIADVAHMTPTYFSSVFKKFNGVSPWEYITIKRVEKAIEMLRTTNMTKLEIAERCGFSSSSNFYKAFVAITGKKPNDYVQKTSKT